MSMSACEAGGTEVREPQTPGEGSRQPWAKAPGWCACACVCVCAHTHACVYMCAHACTRVCMCVHMCVCVCMHVCVHESFSRV